MKTPHQIVSLSSNDWPESIDDWDVELVSDTDGVIQILVQLLIKLKDLLVNQLFHARFAKTKISAKLK